MSRSDDVEPAVAPAAASTDKDVVPVWLAILVLVLLLAVMVAGGWLLRGVLGGGTTDEAELEIREKRARVEAAPEDMHARLELAFAYQQAQRYREAIDNYDIVLAEDPRDTAALYNKGMIHLELDLEDSAEAHLWDVLEIDPGHVLAASALGEMYAERGHYRSLVEAVRPVVETNPSAADLQYLMGLAYENLGRADWAEARYRLALKYVPDMPEAHEGLERLGVQP